MIPFVLLALMALVAWGPEISFTAEPRPELPDPKRRRSWWLSRTRRPK